MSPLGFLSGATGNPINSKLRVAQQSALGTPATTALRDFVANSGVAVIDKQAVERLVISPGGAPLTKLAGKAVIGERNLDLGDVDPSNRGLLQMLANLFGKYAVTDLTTWQKWIFGLDGPTTPARFLTIHEDTDTLPRMTLYDIRVAGVTLSAAPSANFQITVDLLVGAYHFFGDVVQTAGAGSTLPILTRTFDGNWEPTVDKDIFVNVFTKVSEDITIKAKIGAAAGFGGTAQPYTLGGSPLRLRDETDARIGKVREQVRAFWPAAATLVAPTDIFRIPNRRAAWAQTLAPERPIASVNTQFILAGQEIRVEGGWEITMAWENGEVVQDTSNEQGGTPDISGELVTTLTLTRRITDLDVQRALHERTPVSVVVDAFSESKISTSGREFRCSVILPEVVPEGEMFGVEAGGTNRDENPTLVARTPAAALVHDGNSFASASHILVENDVTAL